MYQPMTTPPVSASQTGSVRHFQLGVACVSGSRGAVRRLDRAMSGALHSHAAGGSGASRHVCRLPRFWSAVPASMSFHVGWLGLDDRAVAKLTEGRSVDTKQIAVDALVVFTKLGPGPLNLSGGRAQLWKDGGHLYGSGNGVHDFGDVLARREVRIVHDLSY